MVCVALLLFYMQVLVVFSNIPAVQGRAWFTKVPPSVLYVSAGKTARLGWDYIVEDRTIDFQDHSPEWSFYERNGSKVLIGYELVFEERKWEINNPTCPKRLLNPTRVSKESNATLVITNVTTSDSGTYECLLNLATFNAIRNKVQLVVTKKPRILISRTSTLPTNITEGEGLNINCYATGPPTPNVTWTSMAHKDIKSEGVGNATLKIENITRSRSGLYECRARNNQNEAPSTKTIEIVVFYKPNIVNFTMSSVGGIISLQCIAKGQPPPLVTWYNASGEQIISGTKPAKKDESVLTFKAEDGANYRQYKCEAENVVGKDEHLFNLTAWVSLVPPSVSIAQKTTQPTKSATNKQNTLMTSIKKVSARVPKPKKSGRNSNVTPLAAGGFGLGILLVVVILTTVLIIAWKKSKQNKKNKASIKSENKIGKPPSNTETDAKEQEMPTYAQVDLSKKKKNRLQLQDDMPIYAQVEKSKKKRPGQIIYAELEELKQKDEMPGTMLPLPYEVSEYAEIQGSNREEQHIDPIYEIL